MSMVFFFLLIIGSSKISESFFGCAWYKSPESIKFTIPKKMLVCVLFVIDACQVDRGMLLLSMALRQ